MPPIRALVTVLCFGLLLALQVPPPVRAQDEQPQTTIEAVGAALAGDYGFYDVDPAVQQQLADELLRLLEPRAGELGTSAPHGEQNRISDFAVQTDGLGKYWAEWSYVNAGDYNRDGTVDAYDLAPVAHCYQAVRNEPDWTEEAAQADGNGDGVVDLADVEVIASNYGNCVTRYRVVGSWNPADLLAEATQTGDFQVELARLPVVTDSEDDYQVPSRFSVELNVSERPPYIWAEPLAEVRGAVSELNAPPDLMAILDVGAYSGPVPLKILFNAITSVGDNDAIQPSWDLDGDGLFGESGAESIDQDELWYPAVTLEEPCGRLVGVRLTDADGRQDTELAPVLAYRALGWPQLDPQLSDRRSVSLIGGRVAIAYPVKLKAGGCQLRYLMAAGGDAATWQVPLDAAQLTAEPASFQLAEIAGRPALLYTLAPGPDAFPGSYYVSAIDAAGKRWNPPVIVLDESSTNTSLPLLAEVAGRPALVYWRPLPLSGKQVKPGCEFLFQRATNADGAEWDSPTVIGTLEGHEFIERKPDIRSFGLIGGKPAVFFSVEVLEGTAHMLLQALDAGGSQWGDIDQLSTTYTSHHGGIFPVGGIVSLGDSAAMLCRNTWDLYSKSDYSLAVQDGAVLRTTKLADLPLEPACPFFSGTSNVESGYSEAVYLGQPVDGIAVLVTQHSTAQGPVRLRAAISGDGETWQATPEFQPGAFATVLDCGLCRLPDAETGEERNWLQLVMSGPVGDGDGLWLTRLPLPAEFEWPAEQ